MGCRQTIRDQHHLSVRRILKSQELPRHLQSVLDIGEVWRDVHFGDILAAHVSSKPDDRAGDGGNSRHQGHQFAWLNRFGERVEFDKPQKIPGELRGDQPVQGQSHAFHIDVLPVVSHRTAHVHEHDGGAPRVVSRAMHFHIPSLHAERSLGALAEHGVDQGRGDIQLRNRITELPRPCLLQFHGPLADD